jgi:hypothetical protein
MQTYTRGEAKTMADIMGKGFGVEVTNARGEVEDIYFYSTHEAAYEMAVKFAAMGDCIATVITF